MTEEDAHDVLFKKRTEDAVLNTDFEVKSSPMPLMPIYRRLKKVDRQVEVERYLAAFQRKEQRQRFS